MSRIVEASRIVRVDTGRREHGGMESGAPQTVMVGGDSYMDRIAKYIPGEVVAGYMSLDRLLVPPLETARAMEAGTVVDPVMVKLMPYLPSAVFLLGLLFTPLYIMQVARRSGPRTPWVTQAVLSTLAFVIWAYATQGSFFTHGNLTPGSSIYSNTIAAAMVIVFSLASGLFTPAPVESEH